MGRRMFSEKQIGEMAKNVADQEVEELVEGGTLDNAKPIYCHPIYLERTVSGKELRVTMLIFNNDATPFTLETFKTYLDDLYNANNDARIMASGGAVENNNVIIISFIRKYNNIYYITGIKTSGGTAYGISNSDYNIIMANVTLYDGVNKIN